jgi:putative tricarboxylic transport membrane protein
VRLGDLPLGLLVAALGIAVWWGAQQFPTMAYFRYGPGFFPGLIGILLAGCGLVLALQGLLAGGRARWLELAPWTRVPRHLLDLALVAGAVVAYALTADTLGFLPTAFLLLWALIARLWGRPLPALAVAAIATLLIHQAFVELLLVPLPWGLLEPWSGGLTWR